MDNEAPITNNIYDLIELIRVRTPMYIGDRKLSTLSGFLNGYDFFKIFNNLKSDEDFPPFDYFHDWIALKYDWKKSTAGWKNIILEENENDEEKALKVFFDLFDEFKNLHPISIKQLNITEDNLKFHYSECKIKRIDRANHNAETPIYLFADEVYLIEFSQNFGFIYIVKDKNKGLKPDLSYRFDSQELIKKEIEALFGKLSDWRTCDGNLIMKMKEVLN